MLPENWQKLRLLDICRPRQWPTISKDKFTPDGFPVYGANGQIGYYSEYTHADETIAITCRGATCGTINVVPAKSYITGNAMALDAVNSKIVSQDYLYHSLNHWGVADSITGSAQPQITRESLSKVEFPFPPLPEQRRIAEILGSVDAAIEAAKAVIQRTKTVKQGLLQTLLTRGIGHTEFKNSPLGKIPDGWNSAMIGEVVQLAKAKYDPRIGAEDLPCVELEHIAAEEGRILGATSALKINSIKSRFSEGDVLFGKLRPYLKKYAKPGFAGVCSTEIWVLSPKKNKIDTDFLFQTVQHQPFLEAANRSCGTKMPRAEWSLVSATEIPIPPLSEQRRIADILGSVDTILVENGAIIERFRNLKKGLMEDLLTGKVRVDV